MKATYFVIDPRSKEPIESLTASSAPSVAKIVAKRRTKNVSDYKKHTVKVHVMKDTPSGKTVKVFSVDITQLETPRQIMIAPPKFITVSKDISGPKLVKSYKI